MGGLTKINNGYEYKLIGDITYYTSICSIDFELYRYGYPVTNIDEIYRYTDKLIISIMKNHYSEKYSDFSLNGCLGKIRDNIYSLDWEVKIKFNKYKALKTYCSGEKVNILSGVFRGQEGIFDVKETGIIFKRIYQFILINNNEEKIEDIEFEFKDYENQITYEEILEGRQF